MDHNEKTEEEMNDLVPGFPERPFYSPPQGYYEELPDRLIHRWRFQESARQSKLLNYPRMISAAAMVAGICLGVAWLTHRSNQSLNSSAISASDAYEYIIENLDEFEPLLLQDALWNHDEMSTPASSSAIEEYLLEEMDGDDIETIF